MKILLVAFNARYTHSAPALFYLRNALEANLPGCMVTLRQHTINDPYHETLLTVASGRPEALFFSAYIWSAAVLQRLLIDLRQLLPDIPMVIGGPQAPHLDLPEHIGCTVVHGPVEGLPPRFYDDLAAGRLLPEYRAENGVSFAMPYRPGDFAGELGNRSIYYESSRGCPFACSYCLSSIDRGVRHRELDAVKAELALILRHRPRVVRFVDRTFNAVPARALAIWQYLAALPGETVFHFEVAPDLFTPEMLEFLASLPAGRFQFEIGLQSTNPATLAAINRRTDLNRAHENIGVLAALNTIHLHVDLILGLPFETEESFQQSFNAAFAMAPHYIQMGLLKVLPGTPLAKQAGEYGLLHSAAPPYALLANRWLDQASLARLFWFGETVEAFHNNRYFRALFAYLRGVEPDLFAFFMNLSARCRRQGFFGRAKTQELLSGVLADLAATRPDRAVFLDLLRYDWLSCGHRFVPPHLEPLPLKETRDRLWRMLPEECPPLYDRLTRSEFLKRSIFACFAGPAIKVLGLRDADQAGIVCFLPGNESGVLQRLKTVLLSMATGS